MHFIGCSMSANIRSRFLIINFLQRFFSGGKRRSGRTVCLKPVGEEHEEKIFGVGQQGCVS